MRSLVAGAPRRIGPCLPSWSQSSTSAFFLWHLGNIIWLLFLWWGRQHSLNLFTRLSLHSLQIEPKSIGDYFAFDSSINTQVFLAPGPHTLVVMAEDNQGYVSATPLQITVSAQAPATQGQTTRRHSGYARLAILWRVFPSRGRTRGANLRCRRRDTALSNDSERILAVDG